MEVVISICVGISLSASAGLRAFMPLFMAGFLARWDWIPLGESFEWLSEPPALIALGVAMCCEMAADKIPALDHALSDDALKRLLHQINIAESPSLR